MEMVSKSGGPQVGSLILGREEASALTANSSSSKKSPGRETKHARPSTLADLAPLGELTVEVGRARAMFGGMPKRGETDALGEVAVDSI
jgi:hypothetical protein